MSNVLELSRRTMAYLEANEEDNHAKAEATDAFPAVYEAVSKAHTAYEGLGRACHASGPLEPKTRELVQLGMAIGIRSEGAVHSHVKKALDAGASPEEIRHAVLLGIPTLGLPTTVAAFTWIGDILESRPRSHTKKKG